MDITPFTDLKIAPRAVFDALPERRTRARFMLPTQDGPTGRDWQAVTWGAFADQIRRLARFLDTAELRSGERAAIFSGNRVEWLSAALAIQAQGGVMVPVYPASTAEQAAYVVTHADARVLFVDGAQPLSRLLSAWRAVDQTVRRVVLLDDALDPAAALANLRAAGQDVPSFAAIEPRFVTLSRALAIGADRDREDPAAFDRVMGGVSLDQPGMMLYTSGTSGNPKGVPLTHRNVGVNGLDWLRCNAPLLDEGAVDLLWLPMSHIFGFGEACLGNTLGFTSYLVSPLTVLDQLPTVKPNVFMSVPSLWEKLAAGVAAEPTPERRREVLRERTGGRLRFCLSGGAGLKREVKELFWDAGMLIVEGYGLTECSPTLTLNRPDAFRFDTVGRPLPSVELKLASDGEILAKGPSVFAGYHKDPVATREAFTADGWFQTGDVGRFTDDGFLQIVDRKKDILVTAGGKNVPPANIELRFRDDPLIAHVVVYGDAKRYLVAGVWPHVPTEITPDFHAHVTAAIQKVNGEVASYETLKRYVAFDAPLTVESGLLTASLKVRRKQVYERYKDTFEALYDDAAMAKVPNAGSIGK